MQIENGLCFTSTHFIGLVVVLEVDSENNRLKVLITQPENSVREEEWNLLHTNWGFDSGDYCQVDKNCKLKPIYDYMALHMTVQIAKEVKQLRVKESNSYKNTLYIIGDNYPAYKKFADGSDLECIFNGHILIESAMRFLKEESKNW